jgi:hypothetical protein
MAYFHAIANGQCRKCATTALASPSGPIINKFAIQEHVYSFYRELMGTEDPQLLTLMEGFWVENQRVSNAENLETVLSFTAQ